MYDIDFTPLFVVLGALAVIGIIALIYWAIQAVMWIAAHVTIT